MADVEQGGEYGISLPLLSDSAEANGSGFFLSYYGVDSSDELPEEEGSGEFRGGKTFWGTIALIQKTFGLNNEEVMWGDSWINLMMKMRDMPHYQYRKSKERIEKKGTVEDLQNNFGKYIKR